MRRPDPHVGLTAEFFQQRQALLLTLLNDGVLGPVIRRFMRMGSRAGRHEEILAISPHHVLLDGPGASKRAVFNSQGPIQRDVYRALWPVVWGMHFADSAVFDRKWWRILHDLARPLRPAFEGFGLSTLTANPQGGAGGTNTTCDATGETDPVAESFAAIIAENTFSSSPSAAGSGVRIDSDPFTTGDYIILRRTIETYNISAIPSVATISAAQLEYRIQNTLSSGLGTPQVDITTASPASASSIGGSDFTNTNLGSTLFASLGAGSITVNAYNILTFNSSGRSYLVGLLSGSGIAAFAARLDWDFTGTGPTWTPSAFSQIGWNSADIGSNPPKLVITYDASTHYTLSVSETITLSESRSIQPRKVLSEGLSVSDSRSMQPRKLLTDTAAAVESIVKQAIKPLAETVSLADQIVKAAFKAVSDGLAITESLVPTKTGMAQLADSIALSSSISLFSFVPFVDVVSASEAFAALRTRALSLSESNPATESIVNATAKRFTETDAASDSLQLANFRTYIETLSISDTSQTLRVILTTVTDDLSSVVADAISYTRQRFCVVSDTIAAVDSIVKSIAHSVSDSIGLSDLIGFVRQRFLAVADTVSMSDSSVNASSKIVTDSTVLSDSVVKGPQKILTDLETVSDSTSMASAKILADTAALDDSIQNALTLPFGDAVFLSDSATKGIGKPLADTITESDRIIRQGRKLLTDSAAATDSITSAPRINRSDVIAISDSSANQSQKALVDATSATDSIVSQPRKSISDTVAVSESMTSLQRWVRTFTDILPPLDALSMQSIKAFIESFSISEALQALLVKNAALSDSITPTDSKKISASKALTDSAAATESTAITPGRNLTDNVSGADSVAFSRVSITTLLDTAAISDFIRTSIGRVYSDSVSTADSISRRTFKFFTEIITLAETFASNVLDSARTYSVPPLVRAFTASETVSCYATKHAGSTEDFSFDLSRIIGSDFYASISWPAVSGLTVADQGVSGSVAKVRIGGGVAGVSPYEVNGIVTMQSGQVREFSLQLLVTAVAVAVLKEQAANEAFQLNWTPQLGGAIINGSPVWSAAPPLVITRQSTKGGTKASAWFGGGNPGTKYASTNTVTLSTGEIKACDLVIMVTR